VRLRKTPIAGTFYIGETAPGEVNVQVGQHLTVREERRPWRRLPRIVGTINAGETYAQTFTPYVDYDTTYTNQNQSIPPQANITADSAGSPVRPAGWTDVGQSYRTVTLHAGTSEARATGATIAAYLWGVGDGTITVGTSASAGITVTFPYATPFRYISLTVTDSNGTTHTRWLPIWVHSTAEDGNTPFVSFAVTQDDRYFDAGREMSFQFRGADNGLSDSSSPKGAPLCYWETAAFGASGTAAPASHIDSFLGWALRDAVRLRKGARSRLIVEVGGLAAWLDRLQGSPHTLTDNETTPTRWDEMTTYLTGFRMANWALQHLSNATELGNVYKNDLTDTSDAVKSITLKAGSLWQQVQQIGASNRVTNVGCDSVNGIWFRRDYSYLDESDRALRATTTALTETDWTDVVGLEIPDEIAPQVGTVEGNGEAKIFNQPYKYASRAPGKTSASGASTAPFSTTSQGREGS
jgi:hypothetical protein